jgi:hypothetical protein
MTTLHELAAQVAELAEEVAALRGESKGRCANPPAPVSVAAPDVTINIPPAPPPLVTVQGNAGDFEITYEWLGSRIVRSIVTRKGGGLLQ